MSLPFLDDNAIQELKNLINRTPLPAVMKAFEEVTDEDIAIFLLLLDVTATDLSTNNPDEIRRKLASIEEKEDREQEEDTLAVYAQKIFAQFSLKRQVLIAEAITETEMVQTDIAERVWQDITGKMKTILDSTLFFGNAAKNLARLLGKVDIEKQNRLMEVLQKNQPGLVDTVSDQLFKFDDLVEMPDESIRTLVQVLETNTLALALYEAPTEVQDRFYENMTPEKAEYVEAETEILTHEQTQLSATARQSVVNLIRNFAGKGLIKIR